MVATSGDLFNIGSNRILNGDSSESAANQRPLFVGRNTVRAPAIFELNARYSRLFPISEHKSFEFMAESTNIMNTLNVTNLSTTAQVDAFGNILAPAAKRSYQRPRPAAHSIGATLQLLTGRSRESRPEFRECITPVSKGDEARSH